MGQGVIAGRWDDWSNIRSMGIPCLIAVSTALAVIIAGVMIGFTLLTLRRVRHRGALPAKVAALRTRGTDQQTTDLSPKDDGGEANRPPG